MPPSRLVIPATVLADLIAHCRAGLPHEAGGLLAGVDGRVTHHFPLRNALASQSRFLSDATETIAAAKACRVAGIEVLAVYHSHPTSAPVPSRRDVDERYGAVTVIVGLAGEVADVRAWHLSETGYGAAAWVVT